MAFDRQRRWLLVARSDGQVAVATIDRNSNVVAWALLETTGAVRTVVCHRGQPHLLIELDGRTLLERFDATAATDHTIHLAGPTPTQIWAGLDHLEGQQVLALAPGADPIRAVVGAGTIVLPEAASELTVGTPITHLIEPLPLVAPTGSGVSLDRPYRPVRVVFRVLGTGALRADVGDGNRLIDLGTPQAGGHTGDVVVRALGWRRGVRLPAWRIEQDDPAPCTVLSVTTEIKGEA
jgi:hypothetical protein